MKFCPKCGKTQPLTNFAGNKQRKDGLQCYCKPCMRLAQKASYEVDPSRWAKRERKNRLRREFGLTADIYDAMLEAQRGVCAICHMPDSRGIRLAIDHCHTTGQVRALLCGPCNLALGNMQDSPDRLRAAAIYLEHHTPPQLAK
jgi:hypothetical protein